MEKQDKCNIQVDGNLTLSANTDNFRLDIVGDEDDYISSKGFQLATRYYYNWGPKKDITPYELAKCMPIVVGMQTMGAIYHNWKEAVNSLPKNCQRHFAKVEG